MLQHSKVPFQSLGLSGVQGSPTVQHDLCCSAADRRVPCVFHVLLYCFDAQCTVGQQCCCAEQVSFPIEVQLVSGIMKRLLSSANLEESFEADPNSSGSAGDCRRPVREVRPPVDDYADHTDLSPQGRPKSVSADTRSGACRSASVTSQRSLPSTLFDEVFGGFNLYVHEL